MSQCSIYMVVGIGENTIFDKIAEAVGYDEDNLEEAGIFEVEGNFKGDIKGFGIDNELFFIGIDVEEEVKDDKIVSELKQMFVNQVKEFYDADLPIESVEFKIEEYDN